MVVMHRFTAIILTVFELFDGLAESNSILRELYIDRTHVRALCLLEILLVPVIISIQILHDSDAFHILFDEFLDDLSDLLPVFLIFLGRGIYFLRF